jgi:hypothetical protein
MPPRRARLTVGTMRELGWAACLVSMTVMGSACSHAPERQLRRPHYLSEAARQLVHREMGRHAATMLELVWQVTLLEWDGAAATARRIAGPPAAPTPGLNDQLPERFFILQAQLRESAARLASAAEARDPISLSDAFSQVSTTCVACHSVYLKER